MARSSKRRPSKAGKKKTASKGTPSTSSGYDFGAAGVVLSVANDALLQQFGNAAIWGCGYGYFPPTSTTPALPMLALVGANAEPLRAAFEIMREWHDQAGPNAICVEIAYSDPGYVIVVSQDVHALQWRSLGFGNLTTPVSLNFSWGKRMDTRGSALEELAGYFEQPLAPVQFCAATTRFAETAGFELLSDCSPILLAKVHVYRDEAEIPSHSPARRMIDVTAETSPKPSNPPAGPPQETPDALSRQRDQSLIGTVPKTLLVLRHREDGRRLVSSIMERGFGRWQVEQALANLRLKEVASRWPKEEQGAALRQLRQSYAEYAGEPYFPDRIEVSAVLRQIEADLGFLLAKRIKAVPKGVAARMAKLRELGLD